MMLLLILHSDNMLTLLNCGQGQNGSFVDFLISQFKTRVALDGGTFEAESCMKTQLKQIENIS